MTRKLAIGYMFLFLFVFAFTLSFALAGTARAEHICCYEWCDVPFGQIAYYGHWVEDVCVCNGTDPCDHAQPCDITP